MSKKSTESTTGSQGRHEGIPLEKELYAEMVQHPAHLIRRTFQIFLSAFDLDLGQTGLTPVQWMILATVYSFPGIDMTRLAGLAAVDKTSCGRAVAKLADGGLIRLSADKTDGRQKRLSLLPEGQRMVVSALPGARKMRERLLVAFTSQERTAFLSILKTFVTKNNEQSRAPHRALETEEPATSGKRKRGSKQT